MENRLRSGELPDLSQDYMPGQAPETGECRRFMDFAENLKSGAPVQPGASGEPEKKKKGLFGLFR